MAPSNTSGSLATWRRVSLPFVAFLAACSSEGDASQNGGLGADLVSQQLADLHSHRGGDRGHHHHGRWNRCGEHHDGAAGTGGAGGTAGGGAGGTAGGPNEDGGPGGSPNDGGVGGTAGGPQDDGGPGGNPNDGGGGIPLACRWIGDFDGDGVADCAQTQVGATARLDLLFNKGVGPGLYLSSAVVTPDVVPATFYSLYLFDLDHDGRQDIIIYFPDPAAPSDRVSLQLYRGQADGTFVRFAAPAPAEGLGGVLGSLLYLPAFAPNADFDGDGHDDLFAIASQASLYTQYDWVVIKSAGGADFAFAQTESYLLRGQAIPKGFVDLNGDHALDVVALARQNLVPGLTSYVGISLGVGDGRFLGSTAVPGTDGATDVAIADVNGDGKADLLVTLPAGVTPLYGDGAAHFSPTP